MRVNRIKSAWEYSKKAKDFLNGSKKWDQVWIRSRDKADMKINWETNEVANVHTDWTIGTFFKLEGKKMAQFISENL